LAGPEDLRAGEITKNSGNFTTFSVWFRLPRYEVMGIQVAREIHNHNAGQNTEQDFKYEPLDITGSG
jgi:hypothetical protein